MKRIKEIDKKLQEIYHERYKTVDLVIRENFGEICDLLEKIGFVDVSKREDIRNYTKPVTNIKGLKSMGFRIEYDTDGHFKINMNKYKSCETMKNKFSYFIFLELNEHNIKEKIKEIRETIKYEYNELLREAKLERILNELDDDIYKLAYQLLDDETVAEMGEEEAVMPEYSWFKELVQDKNHPMYKYVNKALREYKLERILK
jgi:hypothetical protein